MGVIMISKSKMTDVKVGHVIFFSIVLLIPLNIEIIVFNQGKIGGLPSGIPFNIQTILSLSLLLLIPYNNVRKVRIPAVHIWFLMTALLLYLPIFFRNDGVYNQIYSLFTLLPLIPLYLYFLISDIDDLWKLFYKAYFISMIVQSFVSLYQWINKEPLGLFILGESEDPFRKGVSEGFMGVSGTLGHPSMFALFMGIASILALIKGLESKNKLYGLLFVYFYFFVLLSQARTSMGIVTVLSLIIFFYMNKKIMPYVTFTLLSVLSLYLLSKFTKVLDRFLKSDFLRQINDRGHLNEGALDILESNLSLFFMGIGQNNYSLLAQKIYSGGFASIHPVHNVYLLSLIENGVLLSLIIFFAILFIYFKNMISLLNDSSENKLMLLSIVSVLTFVLLYGVTDWALVNFPAALTIQLMILFIVNKGRMVNKEFQEI